MSQFLNKMVHALVGGDKDTAKEQLAQHLNSVAARLINQSDTSQETTPVAPVNESNAFDVYKDGKKIDTVYYKGDETAADVKKSLVDHDGYDSDIVVKQRKTK